jgi:hypothetical protein
MSSSFHQKRRVSLCSKRETTIGVFSYTPKRKKASPIRDRPIAKKLAKRSNASSSGGTEEEA